MTFDVIVLASAAYSLFVRQRPPKSLPSRKEGHADAIDVLAQRRVLDAGIRLHVELIGQRQIVEFAGDQRRKHGIDITEERKVDIGFVAEVSFGAGAKNAYFSDARLLLEDAADQA
jgi:hypothetical protein